MLSSEGYALACVALCVAAGAAFAQAPGTDNQVFYVATDGSDAWSGRLPEANAAGDDGPFATIERARDAVRALDADGPVSVLIRGGRYFIDETIRLGPEDSGTEEAPVTYAAYPGERPEPVGGRAIEGLQAGDDYTLRPGSPAFELGFEAIDVSGVGVRRGIGEGERRRQRTTNGNDGRRRQTAQSG